ncbi:hypothetical protein ACU18_02240 [Arthrobacter sp. ZBG10]|nr:hypothetical protein ACU18_02240 [Arthrobacter sp. ZBG10]
MFRVSGKSRKHGPAGLGPVKLAAADFSLLRLHAGQLAGMAALTDGRDVLAVMPTGYGKSAIHQVAARYLHNTTGRPAVVISPVIALQEDQLDGLSADLGADCAAGGAAPVSSLALGAVPDGPEGGTAEADVPERGPGSLPRR